MKIKHILTFLLVVLLCAFANDLWAQCPMCKASLEGARANGTSVGNTLNSGILYLLVLPYGIATVFGVIFYRNHQLCKKQRSAGE